MVLDHASAQLFFQWVLFVLIVAGWYLNVKKHGQPRPNPQLTYDANHATIATTIVLVLLWFAGALPF